MDGPITDWDEDAVQAFMASIGLPQYENQIREHAISGDVLTVVDADTLKELGIQSVGQRLAVLKAVYHLKLEQGIPIEPDHYVPPSETQEGQEEVSVGKLNNIVRDQSERLRSLEQDYRRLQETLQSCMEDLSAIRSSQSRGPGDESPTDRNTSFKWANLPNKSPTKGNGLGGLGESPQPSPMKPEHEIGGNAQRSKLDNSVTAPPKPVRQESSDNLKSFKVSLEDPAYKVLPAALKKYKINNDDWQNYAMFICYGSSGNRIERCLSYDEKPLLLFQKLKDAKKNPVFMLKHIKDIRSPIVVAQQKHAARKASESSPQPPAQTPSGQASGKPPVSGRTGARPPKLVVHDGMAASTPVIMTANPLQPGWADLMSPQVESANAQSAGSAGDSKRNLIASPADSASTAVSPAVGPVRETPVPIHGAVSYAVAIYPYMAEQDDEFDVVVGDTFVILSRARGWWVVQRDPTGSGVVETDTSKQGWVPAGCLLETNVPVASAIAEATARSSIDHPTAGGGGSGSSSQPGSPTGRTPILPLSIVSTSFPGVALMEYSKKGEEELDLIKDELLRVFKRYNHWSYAVKEESGDRGWVPSWYIGKVSTSAGGVPPTPSTTVAPTSMSSLSQQSVSLDSDGATLAAQPSPMSSAFPLQKPAATM